MCSSREQLSVLRTSTMPSSGLSARFAIPVLKFMLVMSRIAVPVVSEPVPAVVGTGWMSGTGTMHAKKTAVLTCDERAECIRDGLALAHGRVDEVKEVRILVDGEPGAR
jgi:hypothetical protein